MSMRHPSHDHRDLHNNQKNRWPTSQNSRDPPKAPTNSLGTAAIVFIGIGAGIVLIVLIVCLVLWIRSARRKPDYRAPTKVVGRGIQRPSFFPFQSFRRHNEPEIVYCPSPAGGSVNYSIQTPYTFQASTLTIVPPTTTTTTTITPIKSATAPAKPARARNFLSVSSDPPTTRATIV